MFDPPFLSEPGGAAIKHLHFLIGRCSIEAQSSTAGLIAAHSSEETRRFEAAGYGISARRSVTTKRRLARSITHGAMRLIHTNSRAIGGKITSRRGCCTSPTTARATSSVDRRRRRGGIGRTHLLTP